MRHRLIGRVRDHDSGRPLSCGRSGDPDTEPSSSSADQDDLALVGKRLAESSQLQFQETAGPSRTI